MSNNDEAEEYLPLNERYRLSESATHEKMMQPLFEILDEREALLYIEELIRHTSRSGLMRREALSITFGFICQALNEAEKFDGETGIARELFLKPFATKRISADPTSTFKLDEGMSDEELRQFGKALETERRNQSETNQPEVKRFQFAEWLEN